MSRFYFALRNFLIFMFVTVIFQDAVTFGAGTLLDKIMLGLVFAFILTFASNVLKFFKIPVSIPSEFLINVIMTFVLFLVLHSPFNFIRIEAKNVITGIYMIDPISFTDTTMGIVILSLTVAVFVSLFDFIHKNS